MDCRGPRRPSLALPHGSAPLPIVDRSTNCPKLSRFVARADGSGFGAHLVKGGYFATGARKDELAKTAGEGIPDLWRR